MADHDQVGLVVRGRFQNLIGRVADEDVSVECHIALLCLTSQAVKQILIVPRGIRHGRRECASRSSSLRVADGNALRRRRGG
jgi:hypothetical protein